PLAARGRGVEIEPAEQPRGVGDSAREAHARVDPERAGEGVESPRLRAAADHDEARAWPCAGHAGKGLEEDVDGLDGVEQRDDPDAELAVSETEGGPRRLA